MPDNSLDNVSGIGDNVYNDLDEIVVEMGNQRPIHDPECKHETLIPEPEDTIGDAVYHGCAVCPVGFYIQTK